MSAWVRACKAGDVAAEDVIRFDHGGETYAIYRSADDKYYATQGLCTHGQVHLSGGFVMGSIIECPEHNGASTFAPARPRRLPACINLKTCPVKVEGSEVFLQITRSHAPRYV